MFKSVELLFNTFNELHCYVAPTYTKGATLARRARLGKLIPPEHGGAPPLPPLCSIFQN
jgi:hypothetical protein